jgi:hypothetical protein
VSISTVCPKCTKKLNAPDALAGKRAKCPQCATVVLVPEIRMDAAVVAAAPFAPEPPPPPQPSIWDEDLNYRIPPLPKAAPAEEPARPVDEPPRGKKKKRKRTCGEQDASLNLLEWLLCICGGPIATIVAVVYIAQGKQKGYRMLGFGAAFTGFWRLMYYLTEGVPPGRHLP